MMVSRMIVIRFLKLFFRKVIHVCRQVDIGLGQFPLLHPLVQGCALLQPQTIERDVGRVQGQELRHGISPLGQGLLGQTVHQVQVDVAETGPLSPGKGVEGLPGVVTSSQHGKQSIIQALHADAEPVNPLLQQAAAGLLVQVVGVGFCGYLRIGFKLK